MTWDPWPLPSSEDSRSHGCLQVLVLVSLLGWMGPWEGGPSGVPILVCKPRPLSQRTVRFVRTVLVRFEQLSLGCPWVSEDVRMAHIHHRVLRRDCNLAGLARVLYLANPQSSCVPRRRWRRPRKAERGPCLKESGHIYLVDHPDRELHGIVHLASVTGSSCCGDIVRTPPVSVAASPLTGEQLCSK